MKTNPFIVSTVQAIRENFAQTNVVDSPLALRLVLKAVYSELSDKGRRELFEVIVDDIVEVIGEAAAARYLDILEGKREQKEKKCSHYPYKLLSCGGDGVEERECIACGHKWKIVD